MNIFGGNKNILGDNGGEYNNEGGVTRSSGGGSRGFMEHLGDMAARDRSVEPNYNPMMVPKVMTDEKESRGRSRPNQERRSSKEDVGGDASVRWQEDMQEREQLEKEEIRLALERAQVEKDELERIRLSHSLKRMAGNSVPPNIDRLELRRLKQLCQEHKTVRRSTFIVRLMRRFIVFVAHVVEEGIGKLDHQHKRVDLRGWSQYLEGEMDSYEELLHDIYDYYLTDFNQNPVMTLVVALTSNAMCFSMQQRVANNPLLQMLEKGIGGRDGDGTAVEVGEEGRDTKTGTGLLSRVFGESGLKHAASIQSSNQSFVQQKINQRRSAMRGIQTGEEGVSETQKLNLTLRRGGNSLISNKKESERGKHASDRNFVKDDVSSISGMDIAAEQAQQQRKERKLS